MYISGGGTFWKEETAHAKAPRQSELGMTGGQQAGQCGRTEGAGEGTAGGQPSEGASLRRDPAASATAGPSDVC